MKRVITTIFGASIMALALADPALAQATAESAAAANENSDIIVTAQRRAERTQDVPITITSLSADTLREANVQQLGDIVKLTPGVRFDYAANFVQPTIRGIGTAVVSSGAGSNVGIYVDGYYVPNPLAGDTQLLNVQNIQVLKGPQGTLFGRNATGGAILVTTAKPGQEPHGMLEAAYGSFDTFRAQGYATGGLTDNIAFDLEAGYRSSDGYLHNIITGSDKDGRYENWSVRAGLNFDVSDNVSFLLRYMHQDVNDATNLAINTLRQDGVTYASPFVPPELVATGSRELSSTEFSYFRMKADVFQLTGSFDLDWANLTSYSQYRRDDTFTYQDSDHTAAPLVTVTIGVLDKTFTQELLLTSKPGGKLQWTAGLFYFNYVDRFFPVQLSTGGSPFFTYAGSSSKTESIAGYADLTYEVADHLFFTAGARYSHDTVSDASVYNFLTGLFEPADGLSGDRVTPRAVLRYELSDRSSVYASYTRGYKAGIIDLPRPTGPAEVKPEVLDAFEIGYKYASRRFSLDLASWYYGYKDLQVSSFPNNLARVDNAATARIYGVEGQVRYQFTPDFEVNASAAYVNAKYRSFPNSSRYVLCSDAVACGDSFGLFPPVTFDSSGMRMQRAPTFTGSFGARYSMDLGGGRLALSGNLYYTSKIFFDPSEQFHQKAYELLSLRAEWTDPSDRFTLAIYGDNVTDRRYLAQVAYHTPGIGAHWGAPATVGGSVRMKF